MVRRSRRIADADGKPVTSASGFHGLTPDRSAEVDENADLDAMARSSASDPSGGDAPPDVSDLLTAVATRGGVVGGICAGTLALARAGLSRQSQAAPGTGPTIRSCRSSAHRRRDGAGDVPHGGQVVLVRPISIPAGTFAYCLDPDGNSFGLFV